MPITYNLIASNTLSTTATVVTFSSIPGTYTDLLVKYSMRTDTAGADGAQVRLTFNGNATNYSNVRLQGNGAAVSTTYVSGAAYFEVEAGSPSAGNTANTFNSTEIYIPNYTVATNKSLGAFEVGENNSTTAYMSVRAALWQNTGAITSIALTANGGNFVANSSFWLYGIKNS